MKNVARFIFIVLFAFISINAIGQSVLVKGGVSFARVAIKDAATGTLFNNGTKLKLGAHLGISYEKKISGVFFLEVGSMLHWKGSNSRNTAINFEKLNVVYLELPILVKGYFELNKNILVYNAVGPYLGIGLWGVKRNWNSQEIDWGHDKRDDFKRKDIGLSLGIGVDYKGTQVGFAYDLSLVNNSSNARSINESFEIMKHRVIRLTFAYRIAK